MKRFILILLLVVSKMAKATDRSYMVSQGQTLNVELFQQSLRSELEMACNSELDNSSTCHISSFLITGIRPFYNLVARGPATSTASNIHIIDISLNSQLVRCNVEFSTENKKIDLKECESSSVKAKIFDQITNIDFKQAGISG